MKTTVALVGALSLAASTALAGTGKQLYGVPAELPAGSTVGVGTVQAVDTGAAIAGTFLVPVTPTVKKRVAGIWRLAADGTLDTTIEPDGVTIVSDETFTGAFDAGLGKLALAGVWGSTTSAHSWFQSFSDAGPAADPPAVDLVGLGQFYSLDHDDANDRFVLAGTKSGRAAVVAVDADGDLDPTFNGTGFVDTGLASNIMQVAVASDGSVVLAFVQWSYFGGSTLHLRRYAANGALLASGSTNIGFMSLHDLTVDASGRPVVTGVTTVTGQGRQASLMRFTTALAADTTFGTAGKASFTFLAAPGQSYCTTCSLGGTELQASGKIVVGGHTATGLVVARVNPNGTLDTTFGTSGTTAASITGGTLHDGGYLDLDPAGGIFVSGNVTHAGARKTALVKLTPSGALDTSFGTAP